MFVCLSVFECVFFLSIIGTRIVFCRTRRETKDVAYKLMNDGYNADTLNGEDEDVSICLGSRR